MNERDTLQLFDLSLAREIISLDREGLWRFVSERLDTFREMRQRRSLFIPPKHLPRDDRRAFDGFYDEDPADVQQALIEDLCYRGTEMRISYYARCGYLDSHLSVPTGAEGSVIPSPHFLSWPSESEAWYWAGRFDLLTARHVGLMITSLNAHKDAYEPLPPSDRKHFFHVETPADFDAELSFLTSVHYSLITDPTLRAALAYHV
jgi:hypothetical protein